MCSFLELQMENYQGDLTDIVRASGRPIGEQDVPSPTRLLFQSDDAMNFSSSLLESNRNDINTFGDPFSSMRDPLLHELNMDVSSGYNNYHTSNSSSDIFSPRVRDDSFCSSVKNSLLPQKIFEDDLKSPCNIFSRIQISPNPKSKLPLSPCNSPPVIAAAAAATSSSSSSPTGIKAHLMLPTDLINSNTSKGCLVDHTTAGPVQISSPRNLGIKRRKSQAKKVVCIPAPAAANSRSSGEVVPSDLWAWRKYGQKPIKGSPYPRGYYRCSSSKGCSARKQVERSRTDPNMLVITYTSEHNHPWPTSRNALAGSTRSQPSKNMNNNNNNAALKELSKEDHHPPKDKSTTTFSPILGSSSSTQSASVKEETDDQEIEKQLEMETELLPESHQSDQDFFADLDEIDTDPLNLLFTQGFTGDHSKADKDLDPFSLFDWSGDSNNNNSSNTSFGESTRRDT